ncbi:MAG: hypothetical protein FJ225_10900 [Lentisphaerae bacterium]|nr:hypothetical protein [Lentisphaerota bacterium]
MIIEISDHLDENSAADIVPAMQRALAACRAAEKPTLRFAPALYHFRADRAPERFYYISNNDSGVRRIAFPLIGVNGLTVDGGGAEFLFHGRITPFVVDHSSDITLRNFSVDYDRPFFSQGEVVACTEESLDLRIDTVEFPYRVDGGSLVFTAPDWSSTHDWCWLVTEFDPRTRAPTNNMFYYPIKNKGVSFAHIDKTFDDWAQPFSATELEPGLVRLHYKTPWRHTIGHFVTLGHEKRNNPGVFIHESARVTVEDVRMHHVGAMGLIAQLSTDITLKRLDVSVRPGSSRMVSVKADATHFVNCEGTIRMEDCRFDNMLDDATNVHGIYSRISGLIGHDGIEAELRHFQQHGICSYRPGDRVAFTDNQSMQTVREGVVAEVRVLNAQHFELRMREPIPDGVKPGFAIANVTRMPAVVIRGCRTGNNRPRGFLLTSNRPMVIEGNTFYNSSHAIHVSSDANYWNESGPVHDLVIRGNTFRNCGYADGAAPVNIHPEIPKPAESGPAYHRGIVIEDNTFISPNPNLLSAGHVDGLVFRNNRVKASDAFAPNAAGKPPVQLWGCRDATVGETARK